MNTEASIYYSKNVNFLQVCPERRTSVLSQAFAATVARCDGMH
jgi:hypothetical protein